LLPLQLISNIVKAKALKNIHNYKFQLNFRIPLKFITEEYLLPACYPTFIPLQFIIYIRDIKLTYSGLRAASPLPAITPDRKKGGKAN